MKYIINPFHKTTRFNIPGKLPENKKAVKEASAITSENHIGNSSNDDISETLKIHNRQKRFKAQLSSSSQDDSITCSSNSNSNGSTAIQTNTNTFDTENVAYDNDVFITDTIAIYASKLAQINANNDYCIDSVDSNHSSLSS